MLQLIRILKIVSLFMANKISTSKGLSNFQIFKSDHKLKGIMHRAYEFFINASHPSSKPTGRNIDFDQRRGLQSSPRLLAPMQQAVLIGHYTIKRCGLRPSQHVKRGIQRDESKRMSFIKLFSFIRKNLKLLFVSFKGACLTYFSCQLLFNWFPLIFFYRIFTLLTPRGARGV